MSLLKKLILTIWDNVEFGCELAYAAARLSGLRVMLADLDLLSPKADLFLDLKKYPRHIVNDGLLGSSGLNAVLDSIEKNISTEEIMLGVSPHRERN